MMQTTQKYRLGTMILSLALIAIGCASTELVKGTAGNIVGSWKFKDPTYGAQTLTFRNDGVYELDYDGNGVRDIWGSYRMSRDWLIMNDVGGDFVFDCGQQGAYHYKVKGEELTFTLMADQCPSRHEAMSVEWVKIPGAPRVTPVIKI